MVSMIRGIVKRIAAAKGRLARFDADGRAGEEISDREAIQQYGVMSRPPAGAECLILRSGANIYMIASDDRRYRIALKEGEVALNDMHGNTVHLQEGGKIAVTATSEVKIEAAKAVINAGKTVLGDEAAATQSVGVMTGALICPITGLDHAIAAPSVKAAMDASAQASASAGIAAKVAAADAAAAAVICPFTTLPHAPGYQGKA